MSKRIGKLLLLVAIVGGGARFSRLACSNLNPPPLTAAPVHAKNVLSFLVNVTTVAARGGAARRAFGM